ncbi:peptidylprolyl isomerase [Dyadobacter sp. LHD-138]|uniref:peptidylprolyl isomerase n=1 Tax=Dyadobacter sp. LHD-138 TaxID=3071413 RepID=UPI0027E171A9|nr:peptidylprolyl isomerase [Dyadobacter sp. LHD-138]MDQ6478223.1 peptidylprolyl isomerase [Dyadobacter sp. LHD-138]
MKPTSKFSGILLISFLAFFSISFAQKIMVSTDRGNIQLELYPEKAPLTCKNFLKYVNENKYNGAVFYRAVRLNNQPTNKVKIEVIQGGLQNDTIGNFPPIAHESTNMTGIKHVNGTLSMARTIPGSATSEFFICINDQPELDYNGKRNPDKQGFAAFGKVISGMDVVLKIQQEKTGQGDKIQSLKTPVKIISMRRIK